MTLPSGIAEPKLRSERTKYQLSPEADDVVWVSKVPRRVARLEARDLQLRRPYRITFCGSILVFEQVPI